MPPPTPRPAVRTLSDRLPPTRGRERQVGRDEALGARRAGLAARTVAGFQYAVFECPVD